MAEGDGAAHDVQLLPRDTPDPVLLEDDEGRQDLRGERLVHLEEIDVVQSQPGATERDRDRVRGRDEQLIGRIDRRVRVAPDRGERLPPEGPRARLAREDDGRGAVGQRTRVAGGDRPMLAIEDRPQRAELLQGRVAADVVVVGDGVPVEVHRSDLRAETPVVPTRGGALVAPKRPRVLIAPRYPVHRRHTLGRLTHRQAGRRLADARSDRRDVREPHLREALRLRGKALRL